MVHVVGQEVEPVESKAHFRVLKRARRAVLKALHGAGEEDAEEEAGGDAGGKPT